MFKQYLIPVLTGLVVAVLAWLVLPRDSSTAIPVVDSGGGIENIEARLRMLETELEAERAARQALEQSYGRAGGVSGQQVALVAAPGTDAPDTNDPDEPAGASFSLLAVGAGETGETVIVSAQDGGNASPANESVRSARQVARARAEAIMEGREREFLAEQLVERGFSSEEADHIATRESELRLESLYADHEQRLREAEAARNATADGQPVPQRLSAQEQLRRELGDENYAKYLESSGRSTTVGIRSVMESSPAQMAGLQPGDEIVSYNGDRVFSISEINQKTIEGIQGESVLVEVMRQGEQVQVTIPRGPIGVSTGRSFATRN